MEEKGVAWSVLSSFCSVKTNITLSIWRNLVVSFFCYVGSFYETKEEHLNLKWFNLIANCFLEDMIFVCGLYGSV